MELGGPAHEACAGVVALTAYLRTLASAAQRAGFASVEMNGSGPAEPAEDSGSGAAYGGHVWGKPANAGADSGNSALRIPRLTRAEVVAAYAAMQGSVYAPHAMCCTWQITCLSWHRYQWLEHSDVRLYTTA